MTVVCYFHNLKNKSHQTAEKQNGSYYELTKVCFYKVLLYISVFPYYFIIIIHFILVSGLISSSELQVLCKSIKLGIISKLISHNEFEIQESYIPARKSKKIFKS